MGFSLSDFGAKALSTIGIDTTSPVAASKGVDFSRFIEDAETKKNAELVITSGNYTNNTLTGARRLAITGIVTSDFTLTGGSEFKSSEDQLGMVSSFLEKVNFASAVKGMVGGKGSISNVASTARSQTIAFYSGTKKPSFTLDVVFITTDSKHQNTTTAVTNIMQCVYPLLKGTNKEIMQAPFGYTPTVQAGKEAKGTLTIGVGNWFKARKVIMTDASFTFSKEVTKTGTPLMATGSITFEPFRAIGWDELVEYFPKYGV